MKTSVRSPLPCQLCTGILLLWIMFSTLSTYGEAQIDRAALEQALSAHPVDVSYVFPSNTDLTTSKPLSDPQTTANAVESATHLPINIVSDTINRLTLNSKAYQQPVTVYQSRITDRAEVFLSQFYQRFDFNHNQVAQNIIFYQSIFKETFVFSFNRLSGRFDISSTHFRDEANFYNNRFQQASSVHLSTFDKVARFNHSTYSGKSSFENTIFHDDVSFDSSIFSDTLSFKGSVFDGHVRFHDAFLPRKIDLSNVVINGPNIQLDHAKAHDNTQDILINLLGTDLHKIDFEYTLFKLDFPDIATYQDIANIYTQLLEKYKREGMEKSYQKLYREYRQYEFTAKKQHVLNFVHKHWWDYGLDKNRLFSWFLLIMTVLTLINCLYYDTLVTTYFNIYFLDAVKPDIACQQNPILNYLHNIPRAIFLTIFLVFASFLQHLVGEEKIFKTDHFLINSYVIFINCLGYIFLLFFLEILFN